MLEGPPPSPSVPVELWRFAQHPLRQATSVGEDLPCPPHPRKGAAAAYELLISSSLGEVRKDRHNSALRCRFARGPAASEAPRRDQDRQLDKTMMSADVTGSSATSAHPAARRIGSRRERTATIANAANATTTSMAAHFGRREIILGFTRLLHESNMSPAGEHRSCSARCLGPVDKPRPDADASEQDESDEGGGELVISGGETPLLLEMPNEALNP